MIFNMKLTPKMLKKIEKFAFDKVRKNDILHQRDHIERVVDNCRILARKEKADSRICKAAALLHDIERGKSKNLDHAKIGAGKARKFLRKLKVDEDIIERICYAVYKHNKNLPNKTIESRVVHDADNLDALGASGFLRLIIYGVIIKHLDYKQTIKYAVKEQKKFSKWLQTKTAKKMAKGKIKEVKIFLKHL